MEEPQGTQQQQGVRREYRVRRKRRRPVDPVYNRGISSLFHFLAFVMVALLGVMLPWVYYAYHPLMLRAQFGLVGYYLYFALWLAVEIYLCSGVIFDKSRHWWQLAVFVVAGVVLGYVGGWFFARGLGTWVGALTGVFISPLVFLFRWWFLGLDIPL